MSSFKETCITLREQGYTLDEISVVTGRPKTSVYTHIRSIPLSEERMTAYRKASGKRIRPFALARAGKSERSFIAFDTWTPRTVLLTSHLLFDGEIKRTRCCYNNRSTKLIERVQDLMRDIYTFEPKVYVNTQTGVTRIAYHNVALGAHFLIKSDELLKVIQLLPRECQREFIRAFFDDEGCMDYRPLRNVRQVRGYQHSLPLLKDVQNLLTNFGITSKISSENEIRILGKENLTRFQKEIDFSPGVCINGNRSNSIWKDSLEKRHLLGFALASFKS